MYFVSLKVAKQVIMLSCNKGRTRSTVTACYLATVFAWLERMLADLGRWNSNEPSTWSVSADIDPNIARLHAHRALERRGETRRDAAVSNFMVDGMNR